jgi:hypothetical protein
MCIDILSLIADEDFAPGSDSDVPEEFDSDAQGSSEGEDDASV